MLGWFCLILNGYEAGSALVTGRISGLASYSNPDPPTWEGRPETYLLFLAFYLGLCVLGVGLLLKARNMPRGR
jgi:hypothetical protein